MDDKKETSIETKQSNNSIEGITASKKPGTIPRKSDLYRRTAKLVPKATKVVKKLLDDPNPLVRIAAAKLVFSRTIPELKAIEITGADGEPLKQYVISFSAGGFLPPGFSPDVIGDLKLNKKSIVSKTAPDEKG